MTTSRPTLSAAPGRPLPSHIARASTCAASVASLLMLAGCLDADTSPAVGQAETATRTGAVSLWSSPQGETASQGLKLAPRHGVRTAYMPGEMPITAVSVRLRTDGCQPGTSLQYTVNFQPSKAGSALVQLASGSVDTPWPEPTDGVEQSSPWVTVTLRENLSSVNQNGNFDLRQLAHPTNSGLPTTCAIVVDQGALRATGSPGFANTTGAGKPRFFLRTNPATNLWMDNPAYSTWNAAHYHRAEVFRPHADQYLPWFNGALVYFKSHSVFDPAGIDPSYFLKDAQGRQARVNWNCGPAINNCQPVLDIGNPAVRAMQVERARQAVTGPNGRTFRGLWVDDVNMNLGLVTQGGQAMTPIDPRTGRPMLEEDWRRYMTETMEALRAALPNAEIYHNAKYYWGVGSPMTTRQISAATGVHLEGGFTDQYLGAGDPNYSVAAMVQYIQKVQGLGRRVIMDSGAHNDQLRDYGLAAYHIFSGPNDMLSSHTGNRPSDWWSGYDIDLGAPTTAAPTAPTPGGLWRRDFANGIALMLQPRSVSQTVYLPRQMVDTNGNVVTSVTLNPRQGAVLTNLPAGGVGGGGVKTKVESFTF